MSVADDDIAPSATGGATPITQVMVPVTTGPLTTVDSRTIPKLTAEPVFYTLSGPQHHDETLYQQSKMYQHLYQQQPLQWGHFNPDSTEETVPGEVADQRWVMDRTQERSDHRILEEGDYNVDARIEALEQGQWEMKRDLKEVILAISDMTNLLNRDWENHWRQEPPSQINEARALTRGGQLPNAPRT
ncbi:UNVERIFIED_CONTAM: hypothetical protein K2H54_036795 [Gekko kuhli]